MLHAELRRIFSDAPSRPIKVFLPIVVVALSFCAVCAYLLMDARRAAFDRSADTASSLAAAIESDLTRSIETLNRSLAAVAENLKQPDIDSISPVLRQRVLFDRPADAKRMGAIIVLDEDGLLRFDSRSAAPPAEDLSARDYFKAHLQGKSSVLYVSQPQFARDSGEFFVGISKRLTHADGSFAGVVASTMRLDYVQQLFKDVSLGSHSTIALSRIDNGGVLVSWPHDAAAAPGLAQRLTQAPRGRFETSAGDDDQVIVYRQIGNLPIVLSIGQPFNDIYSEWRRYAWTVGALLAVLSALAATLAFVLLRELGRRAKLEKRLATLASTDGLTGLSNRWHFDESIEFEWRRARREQETLALIMIDGDLFKIYNDKHGHQVGDRLLQSIGEAIAGRIRGGTDLGARYGGDEFVVLLPGTTLAGAARVANQIRAQFEDDCRERGDEASISMGVSCLLPGSFADPSTLIATADRALYRAKRAGRNRTELAEGEFAKLLEKVA
jgi:diguanylate cyclase (GGDEF)-like protein